MHAKGPALPNQPIQQQRRRLGPVCRRRRTALGIRRSPARCAAESLPIRGENWRGPARPRSRKRSPRCRKTSVEPFQHAHAEFAFALDGDHPRVRQLMRGVGLELDAFFEVDQIELHLVEDCNAKRRLVISACNSVLLPEPVLPEIRACCAVPLPRRTDCSSLAPARPMGTTNSRAVVSVQISPAAGATTSKGTSTRLAARDSSPA